MPLPKGIRQKVDSLLFFMPSLAAVWRHMIRRFMVVVASIYWIGPYMGRFHGGRLPQGCSTGMLGF